MSEGRLLVPADRAGLADALATMAPGDGFLLEPGVPFWPGWEVVDPALPVRGRVTAEAGLLLENVRPPAGRSARMPPGSWGGP